MEEKVSKLRIQAKREELDVARIDGSFDKDNTALDTTDSRREDTSRTAMSFNQKDQISEQRQSLVTSKDGQCDLSHPLVIEKYHVIKALKNFVSILHGDKCGYVIIFKATIFFAM